MKHWEHLSFLFFLAHSGLHIIATLLEHTRDQNKMVGITLAASCIGARRERAERFFCRKGLRRLSPAARTSIVPWRARRTLARAPRPALAQTKTQGDHPRTSRQRVDSGPGAGQGRARERGPLRRAGLIRL